MGCCCKADEADNTPAAASSSGATPAPPEKAIDANRGCTDFLFLLLFAIFWAGMVAVGIKAYVKGDTKRIIYGLDMNGNLCGVKNSDYNGTAGPDFSERKNLYWLQPYDITSNLDPTSRKSVCLSSCPNDTNTFVCIYNGQWDTDYYNSLSASDQLSSQTGTGPCYPVLFSNIVFLNKCFPKPPAALILQVVNGSMATSAVTGKSFFQKAVSEFNKDKLQQHLGNVIRGWGIIVACGLGGGLVLSFVWVMILRFFAGLLIWTTVILLNLIFILFTILCYIRAGKIPQASSYESELQNLPSILNPSSISEKDFLYIGYAMSAITGLLFLFTLVMIRRIALAVACIKIASKAVASMPLLVIFPIIPFAMTTVLLIWWLAVAVFLYSASTVNRHPGGGYDMSWDYTTRYLMIYHVFGLLWTWQFIVGFGYLVISGAVSMYYWYRGHSAFSFPVLVSMKRAFCYHLGSVALGALLVAILQFIELVFAYISKQLKKYHQSNSLIKFILCCIQCFLKCLETILKYINRNTYIIVAMKGTNYCRSAGTAISLIITNVLRIAAVTIVGDILILLGKLLITAVCGVIAFFMCRAKMYSDASSRYYLSSPLFPVMFSCVAGYFISHIFLQVYEMAIDTIMLCYCQDCSMHDGKAMFAPQGLSGTLDGNKG